MAHLQATRLYNKVVGAAAEAQQAEHMKKYAQDQAAGPQQEAQQQSGGVLGEEDAAAAQPAASAMTVAEHLHRKQAVGAALARVVHAHVCLLADTEARQSPTRASVWRAEQCLREWDKLEHAGLAAGAAGLGEHQVGAWAAALLAWCRIGSLPDRVAIINACGPRHLALLHIPMCAGTRARSPACSRCRHRALLSALHLTVL